LHDPESVELDLAGADAAPPPFFPFVVSLNGLEFG
jgi:hypothetical protein